MTKYKMLINFLLKTIDFLLPKPSYKTIYLPQFLYFLQFDHI